MTDQEKSRRESYETCKHSPFVYWSSRAILRVFMLLYHRLLWATGKHPKDTEGGIVYASNHLSNLDAIYLGVLIPPEIHFLAKRELLYIPLVGWYLRHCNVIGLDRKGSDRLGLQKAVRALRGGARLLLFPEGTRSRDGSLSRGKRGVGMIASMAGSRVVPVFLEGLDRAMPRGVTFVYPRKVRVKFGEAFRLPERPEGVTRKEHYQHCSDVMLKRIAELGGCTYDAPSLLAQKPNSEGEKLEEVKP